MDKAQILAKHVKTCVRNAVIQSFVIGSHNVEKETRF